MFDPFDPSSPSVTGRPDVRKAPGDPTRRGLPPARVRSRPRRPAEEEAPGASAERPCPNEPHGVPAGGRADPEAGRQPGSHGAGVEGLSEPDCAPDRDRTIASEPPSVGSHDYEVGSCRPPRHTRFQPGRSGNPRGRPKGSVNLSTALMRELAQPVEVTKNGRRKRMTKAEVAATQMVDAAARGDQKAIIWLVQHQAAHEAAINPPPRPAPPSAALPESVSGFAPEDLTEEQCQALIAGWLSQAEAYR